VLHERDEWRHDHRGTRPQQGRNLVAQRLAATGRHQDQRIAAAEDMLDDRLLVAAECGVAEHAGEDVEWPVGHARMLAKRRRGTLSVPRLRRLNRPAQSSRHRRSNQARRACPAPDPGAGADNAGACRGCKVVCVTPFALERRRSLCCAPYCPSGPDMNDWIQRRRFRRTSIAMLLVCAMAAMLPATRVRAADRPLIFAAASLKPALDEILASPAAQALGAPRASYAASSQLARQIEHGAPAALFISADIDWMDVLDRDGLLEPVTRSNLLGHALVLVAPAASKVRLTIAPDFDLVGVLGAGGRLALAEPRSVPAGKYARSALATLGVWDAVEPRIIAADNVRAAL